MFVNTQNRTNLLIIEQILAKLKKIQTAVNTAWLRLHMHGEKQFVSQRNMGFLFVIASSRLINVVTVQQG